MSLLKFATIAGGVWLEVPADPDAEYAPETRTFRFDAEGRAEWIPLGHLQGNDPAPRWYGHCSTAKDHVFA